MTLQNINGIGFLWPGYTSFAPSNPSMSQVTLLDASGEYHALVLQARENLAITHVGFNCANATGSPTVDIRIETVDSTTGLPTGTLWATDTNVVTGALAGGWLLSALTATANITKGQFYAIKIAYNSGTSVILNGMNGASLGQLNGWSVANTGTPTIGVLTAMLWALGSSSSSFYPLWGPLPATTFATANFNNTNGARRGVKFQLPFACEVTGARFVMPNSAAGDFNIGLWDDGGTEVGTSITAFDRSGMGFGNAVMCTMSFDTAVELAANTNYRLAMEPTSSTNCTMYHMVCPSADYMSAMPGGANCHLTTYASGSWTDSATSTVPWFDLVISKIHDGAGGGGGGGESFAAYVA